MLENYEEMELETMESSSTQSEIRLINSYGTTLNSDSGVRRLNHKDFSNTWSNVPSEVSDLQRFLLWMVLETLENLMGMKT